MPEPKRGGSVGAAWESGQRSGWAQRQPVELTGKDGTFQPRLQPLGSGSDYTAFLDNLGVPSFDFGFGGPLWRLPRGLRQLPLDGEVRRPGFPAITPPPRGCGG